MADKKEQAPQRGPWTIENVSPSTRQFVEENAKEYGETVEKFIDRIINEWSILGTEEEQERKDKEEEDEAKKERAKRPIPPSEMAAFATLMQAHAALAALSRKGVPKSLIEESAAFLCDQMQKARGEPQEK